MAPELADRLAKLLRLACSTGPDGEKLAAISRLSATVAAHDLDWDRMLANGNASGLNEAAASKIYWEGHARGVTETEQRLRPARDWSTEAGSDIERIEAILNAVPQANGLLTSWERDWCDSVGERFRQYRKHLYVSAKMWMIFDRLEAKMRHAGIL